MTQAELFQVQSELSHFNKHECTGISDLKAENKFIDEVKPKPLNSQDKPEIYDSSKSD